MKNRDQIAHIAAILTIIIWGMTFISTKVLLEAFSPIEILFIRFTIGFFALCCIYPHKFVMKERRHTYYFAGAGLCGITLYYLLENIALTYTLASNVGVIISIAPFFTVIFSSIFLHKSRFTFRFFLGFIIAMIGIMLITFARDVTLQVNPLGDILAFIAAIIWALYSIITKKISEFGYSTVQVTRKTFFYGLLFMLPALPLSDFHITFQDFLHLGTILNLMFLGLGASALCFVTWNYAVKVLGSVKVSVYIYMVPVITAITSIIVLQEQLTMTILLGIVLTLTGLFISENREKEGSIHE